MIDTEPGGDRTSHRGRPSAYSPDVAQRVRELVGQGWSMTSICAAIGVDRSTLFRWQQRDPDLCNITDLTVVEQCATPAPEPEPVLAPPAADLEASDDQVVLVVRRKPPACAFAHPAPPAGTAGVPPVPVPPAPRIDPNRNRPPAHWLRNEADDVWKSYVGVDGIIIGGGMCW
jgi:hypothetical protein